MLRKPASPVDDIYGAEPVTEPEQTKPQGWDRKASLRWQLSMVTASMVAIAVAMMTIVAYWTVSTSLTNAVDQELQEKASAFLQNSFDPSFLLSPTAEIQAFKSYNPDVRVAYFSPGAARGIGDNLPITNDEAAVLRGELDMSTNNSGDERVLALRNEVGATLILARDLKSTHQLLSSLGTVLLMIGALGVLIAIATGTVVATTGLRPVMRLQQAAEYVTQTDDLRPIAVVGNDELAQLTRSFNDMLEALEASRVRQTQLVADAGHELKTPLTSLRTNVELLMMVSQSKSAIPPEELESLSRDVIAQIEELSTLIGDLVDLAREDGPQQIVECVDLVECLETSLERVQRRRPDVKFTLNTQPWFLYGDPFALGRATLNLMDNAAKWSPQDGEVRITMTSEKEGVMELTFADSGPGIPAEDREKVFERFYRSIKARSMPGSGLGLAIVQQVINRHAGTIVAEESDDGGALMRVTLPGNPFPPGAPEADFNVSLQPELFDKHRTKKKPLPRALPKVKDRPDNRHKGPVQGIKMDDFSQLWASRQRRYTDE